MKDYENVRQLRPDSVEHQTCACGDPWITTTICVDLDGKVAARMIEGTCASCGVDRLILDTGDTQP